VQEGIYVDQPVDFVINTYNQHIFFDEEEKQKNMCEDKNENLERINKNEDEKNILVDYNEEV
jgi:hypothetical protein